MGNGDYRFERFGSIDVAWRGDLDGGGRGFGQQFVNIVRNLFGPVHRIHEVCAGPGFIGFALLADGLCDSLCLSDINPDAVSAVNETIRRNNLHERVVVYESNAMDGIPAHEMWDLVVGNPPFFDRSIDNQHGIRTSDPDWGMHKKLYVSVRRHLRPHGSCLLMESHKASNERTFIPFIEAGGLKYVDSVMTREHLDFRFGDAYQYPENHFYLVWSRVDHDLLISTSATPPTPVRILLSEGDETGDSPTRLHVGTYCEVTTVNSRRRPVAAFLTGDRPYAANRWTIPVGESAGRRAVYTKPGKLVESVSGRILIEWSVPPANQTPASSRLDRHGGPRAKIADR
jgi:predicted RNA methylase